MSAVGHDETTAPGTASARLNASADGFIPFAGWAGLTATVALIVYDIFGFQALDMPAPAASPSAITAHLIDNAGALEVAIGANLLNLILFAVLFAGIHIRASTDARPWSLVGSFGAILALTIVAVEQATMAAMVALVSSFGTSPTLVSTLWTFDAALLQAVKVGYVLVLLGYCQAGRLSRTMSKWTIRLGFAAASLSIVSLGFAIETVEQATDSWPDSLQAVTFLLLLAWLTAVSVSLIRDRRSEQ